MMKQSRQTRTILSLVVSGVLVFMWGCSAEEDKRPSPAEVSTEKPDLHSSLMTLDSHLDTPAQFHRDSYNFAHRGNWAKDGTQVDLVRLRKGGLDGGFWVIYTQQGRLDKRSYTTARTSALLRQMSIREMAAKYSDAVELAFRADDAKRIHDAGKIVVYQSMENAYPLGEDISLLETFYVGGLRMMGPVHFSNNQFADSATDKEEIYGGLSALGKELIREANRLGIIIDGSHASDAALRQMMEISTTPVILSHSGPDGAYEHPRNVPDELLQELAASGGVIHINAFGSYLEELTESAERLEAMAKLEEEFGEDLASLSAEQLQAYVAARTKVEMQHPRARSSFEVFLEHLFHALELLGPDHVGIGADWDGGGGVIGMEDVAAVPRITEELINAGYSETDIANIWGGNMLRLMRQVEEARTAAVNSPNVIN